MGTYVDALSIAVQNITRHIVGAGQASYTETLYTCPVNCKAEVFLRTIKNPSSVSNSNTFQFFHESMVPTLGTWLQRGAFTPIPANVAAGYAIPSTKTPAEVFYLEAGDRFRINFAFGFGDVNGGEVLDFEVIAIEEKPGV